MLTSSAYLTTAKWVMAGVYFMSYYFITMILAYESAKVEKKPYVVLMILAVMTAMLRHEGIVFILLLIVLLAAEESYRGIELTRVFLMPIFIGAALYYIKVFVILGVQPLYAFLTWRKALIILGTVIFSGVFLIIMDICGKTGLIAVIKKHLFIIVPFVLLMINVGLCVLETETYITNLKVFYVNLRTRAGWGYFGYIAAVVFFGLFIRAVIRKEWSISFFDSIMFAYVLTVIIVSFGRGFELRTGVGDSGNRVLLTSVPIIVYAMVIRLVAYRRDNK
ncbi:MAG: hypothetical protein K6G03_00575, partial [Lachnospiraceae bacterium]|nr:hypothetical protein [Lachnospiraceae bacterium]